MPMRKNVLWICIAVVMLAACDNEDNDLNKILLSAQISYLGEPLQVRNGEISYALCEEGQHNNLQLYRLTPFHWNGVGHTEVSKGKSYRLVRALTTVPWVELQTNDTTFVRDYKGAVIDIKVMPYYMFQQVNIQKEGSHVVAHFIVEDVLGNSHNKKIEKVGLYLSSGIIVDCQSTNLGKIEYNTIAINQPLTFKLPNNQIIHNNSNATTRQYARLGLKVEGIQAMVYSKVFEL